MLVTEKFVYLHEPKTGGTFVTAIIDRIHHARGGRVETVWIDRDGPAALPPVAGDQVVRVMLTSRNQHGTRRDIPVEYADRRVLATIRNPYDRYVSQYEFAWWRVYLEMFGPVETVRHRYPAYPELAFSEFVHLANSSSNDRWRHPASEDSPGLHTQQFVEYFFLNPDVAYEQLSGAAQWRATWARELERLRFLDLRRLNEDLHDFLLSMGYEPDEIAFIPDAGRIRPLQPDGSLAPAWQEDVSGGLGLRVQRTGFDSPEQARWRRVCDPQTRAFIRHKERWLFDWFPQFDV